MDRKRMTTATIPPELLLETMAEGVVVTDPRGRIRGWNAAMTAITGYPREAALGKPVAWLRAPGCQSGEAVSALLAERAGSACLTGCECRVLGRDGKPIPVLMNARVLRHPTGAILGVLQTLTDCRQIEALRGRVRALEDELVPPQSSCGLVGSHPRLREACRLLELAAGSDATVLLLGESGTGKELAAAAVHRLGHRHEGPFIKVNCGALSELILESELFGHVRGAFTGAHQDRLGRFEAAAGGTILLDEIGEISAALQVKLLRILQERQFERVGEVQTRTVDVRVIASTNRDLAGAVRAGRFREDLYYRLKVFPVRMPALRERLEDVPALVEHFAARLRRRTGKAIDGVHPEALRVLMDYRWPGNVRELENVMEYAFITCQSGLIAVDDLPQELRQADLRHAAGMARLAAPAASGADPSVARSTVRSPEALRQLLAACDWSKAEAARRLGLSPTAVWKWMKRHEIPLRPPHER
jgi:PAS domain S-box-containing protein